MRRSVEETFGAGALDDVPRGTGGRRWSRSGHIPFTARAKKSLECGLRQAITLGDTRIGSEHLLLGVLDEGSGLGVRMLRDEGVDLRGLRASTVERSRRFRRLDPPHWRAQVCDLPRRFASCAHGEKPARAGARPVFDAPLSDPSTRLTGCLRHPTASTTPSSTTSATDCARREPCPSQARRAGRAAPTPPTSPTSRVLCATGTDWRFTQEAASQSLPGVVAGEGGSRGMRSIRQPGDGPPWSCCTAGPTRPRFDRALPLLTDPRRRRPCLPATRGLCRTDRRTVHLRHGRDSSPTRWPSRHRARRVVSGGDMGSSVAEQSRRPHPEAVSASHPTDSPTRISSRSTPTTSTTPSASYLDAGRTWQIAEGAYALEQATKPHTLAAALGDSPGRTARLEVRSSAPGATARRG